MSNTWSRVLSEDKITREHTGQFARILSENDLFLPACRGEV